MASAKERLAAERAADIHDLITSARDALSEARKTLRQVEEKMHQDTQVFPDGSARYDVLNVRTAIGGVDLTSAYLSTTEYRWRGYAVARGKR